MGKFVDLTGQRFGRLVVVRREGSYTSKNNTKVTWLCKCDCGGETIVQGTHLRSGYTKSCGCYFRECHSNALRRAWEMYRDEKQKNLNPAGRES